jgi:catecholate siderophore receptor
LYEHSGSYRNAVTLERYGVNPTLAVTPGGQTLLRVGYEYFHDRRTADRGVPSWGSQPLETPPSTFFGDPSGSTSRADVHAVSLFASHRFGQHVEVRNRTRFASYGKFYQNVFASGAVSTDGATVPLSAYNQATDRVNLFSQTDVTSRVTTGSVRHLLLYGAEFGRQETDNLRLTGYFSSGATTLRVPVDDPTVRVPVNYRASTTDADNSGVAQSFAAYVQDQIELTRHVNAVVGLRLDDFDVDMTNRRNGQRFGGRAGAIAASHLLVVEPLRRVAGVGRGVRCHLPRRPVRVDGQHGDRPVLRSSRRRCLLDGSVAPACANQRREPVRHRLLRNGAQQRQHHARRTRHGARDAHHEILKRPASSGPTGVARSAPRLPAVNSRLCCHC